MDWVILWFGRLLHFKTRLLLCSQGTVPKRRRLNRRNLHCTVLRPTVLCDQFDRITGIFSLRTLRSRARIIKTSPSTLVFVNCILSDTLLVTGRQKGSVDVLILHPSSSRVHCIIQHRKSGEVYLFDMSSAHGTYLNKKRIPAREYIPVSVGDMIKFGASTRLYHLHGPQVPGG